MQNADAAVHQVTQPEPPLLHPDPGLQVVALVRERLKVEPQWCVSTERGFTWWPSTLAQRIYADPPTERDGNPIVVVHVEHDVLREVPESDETSLVLSTLNREATLGAFIWNHATRKVVLDSSFAVAASDLPRVDTLATVAAFVQVGEVARQVNQIATMIPGSVVDESSHPLTGLRSTPSPEVFRSFKWCCEKGQAPSAFPTVSDFVEMSQWPRRPWLHASAAPTHFVAEFPFFSERLAKDCGHNPRETSLLHIDATHVHPVLGAGALITLDMPFTPRTAEQVEQLQLDETLCPFGGDFIGAYSVTSNLQFRVFLPNVLALDGLLDYFVWMMDARSHFVKGLVSPRQDILLEHTDVMDLVVTGLMWREMDGTPRPPSDTEDLFRLACEHDNLAEFWNACPRADWMLWLLEWAVGLGVVERPEVNLERFKVAPVAGVHRLAEWLTAQHIQAQALRKALPAPFLNINRTWFNTRKREVDLFIQPGATPIEERLVVKFKKEQPVKRTKQLELDAPVQPPSTEESSPMPNTTTTAPVATPVATPAPRSKSAPSSNAFAFWGLILGLLSVFLYIVGIVPVLAVVFSGMGLAKVKECGGKGKVQAWVGLVLGVIYTLVSLNYYGHIR